MSKFYPTLDDNHLDEFDDWWPIKDRLRRRSERLDEEEGIAHFFSDREDRSYFKDDWDLGDEPGEQSEED